METEELNFFVNQWMREIHRQKGQGKGRERGRKRQRERDRH